MSRRWEKWIWWSVVGLIASAILGLWIAPRYIDWSGLKPKLAAIVSDQLGVEIEPRGRLAIELLPQPKITVSDVVIAHGPDQNPELGGSIRWLRGSLDVPALLLGRIEPSDLTIVEADLVLPGRMTTDPAPVGQATIRVEDSRLRFLDLPDWAPDRLERLNGTLMVGSQAGRLYSFEGEARLREEPIGLSLEGRAGGALSVSLFHGPSASRLSLAGRSVEAGTWRGGVTIETEEASFLSTLHADPLARALGLGPARFSADVTVDREGGVIMVMDEAQSTNLQGSGIITYLPTEGGVVDLALTLTRMIWEDTAVQAGQRVLRWLNRLSGGAIQPKVLASIRMDRIALSDGDVRSLRLDGSLVDGLASFEEARAVLPGGTTLSASGTIDLGGRYPEFEAGLEMISANPRELLASWFADSLPWIESVSEDRMRGAEAHADVRVSEAGIEVSNASGWVGDVTWAGALNVNPADPDAPILAELDLDRLDLRPGEGEQGTGMSEVLGWLGQVLLAPGAEKNIKVFAREMPLTVAPLRNVLLDFSAAQYASAVLTLEAESVANVTAEARVQLEPNGTATVDAIAQIPDPVRFLGALWLPARTAARFSGLGPSDLILSASVAATGGIGYAATLDGEGGRIELGGLLRLGADGGLDRLAVTDGRVAMPSLQMREVAASCSATDQTQWQCEEITGALPGITFTTGAALTRTEAAPPQGPVRLDLNDLSVVVDLGRLGDLVDAPLVADGTVLATGSLSATAAQAGTAFATLRGSLALDGQASFLVQARDGPLLNVGRLQRRLDRAFGTEAPLEGTLTFEPGELSADWRLQGAGATGVSRLDLDTRALQLWSRTDITETGGERVLSLDINGPLAEPNARLSGPWATGR